MVSIYFKVTLPPDKMFPVSKINQLEVALRAHLKSRAGPELQRQMGMTVQNWKHKPIFVTKITSKPDLLESVTYPTGKYADRWKWVSEGTRPRGWTSQNMMIFPREYSPITRPGGHWTGQRRKFGPIVRTHRIRKHRIEPRKFSQYIANKEKRKIKRELNEVVIGVLR